MESHTSHNPSSTHYPPDTDTSSFTSQPVRSPHESLSSIPSMRSSPISSHDAPSGPLDPHLQHEPHSRVSVMDSVSRSSSRSTIRASSKRVQDWLSHSASGSTRASRRLYDESLTTHSTQRPCPGTHSQTHEVFASRSCSILSQSTDQEPVLTSSAQLSDQSSQPNHSAHCGAAHTIKVIIDPSGSTSLAHSEDSVSRASTPATSHRSEPLSETHSVHPVPSRAEAIRDDLASESPAHSGLSMTHLSNGKAQGDQDHAEPSAETAEHTKDCQDSSRSHGNPSATSRDLELDPGHSQSPSPRNRHQQRSPLKLHHAPNRPSPLRNPLADDNGSSSSDFYLDATPQTAETGTSTLVQQQAQAVSHHQRASRPERRTVAHTTSSQTPPPRQRRAREVASRSRSSSHKPGAECPNCPTLAKVPHECWTQRLRVQVTTGGELSCEEVPHHRASKSHAKVKVEMTPRVGDVLSQHGVSPSSSHRKHHRHTTVMVAASTRCKGHCQTKVKLSVPCGSKLSLHID